MAKRAVELWSQMIINPMLNKATIGRKRPGTLLTLVGPCSRVDVHVLIFVPVEEKHLGTEITFDCGWKMSSEMMA